MTKKIFVIFQDLFPTLLNFVRPNYRAHRLKSTKNLTLHTFKKSNIAAAVYDVVFCLNCGTNYISKIANMRMSGRLDDRKKAENSLFLLGIISGGSSK